MAIYDLEGTLGAGEIPSNYFHEAIQTRELTDSECQRRDQDQPVNSQEWTRDMEERKASTRGSTTHSWAGGAQEGWRDNTLLLQRSPLGLGLPVTVESLLKEDLN